MKEVGTFWKFTDGSCYFMVMSNMNTYMSVIGVDAMSKEISYYIMTADDTVLFEPSTNFEMNNVLIEELGKNGVIQ